MNKIFNRGLSFVLCLVLCFGMCTAAFAAGNPDVTLTLDKTTAKENELPATITMTVATTEALSIMGFAGKVTVPEGFTLQEIQSMDKNLSIANVNTQKFGWLVATEENVQNWAKVVFAVPSNLRVGTYKLGLTEIFASHKDNTNPLDGITEKTVTFTVTEKDPDPIAATSVKLDKATLDLTVGGSDTLTANVLPADAADKNVTWKSSDEAVATVVDGVVTAVGKGTATITVTTEDGGFTATCTVTVTAKPVPIKRIALSDAAVSVGRTIQLEPVFTPADTTQRDVIWTSSDRTIATVDANGRVRGVAEGKVTITVTSTADPSITASCTVTVTKNLSDAGLAAIIGGAGESDTFFTDVPGSAWYYDAVKFVYDYDLMDGVGNHKFNPDGTLTRAMIAQVLYNLEGASGAYPSVFTDVADRAWYANAVNWAAAGRSETEFAPNDTMTRQEMAAILYRYAVLKGYDVSKVDSLNGYTDASKVASWAKEAMGWAVENYVINGKGASRLDPTGTATRAQVAQILMNFCNNVL